MEYRLAWIVRGLYEACQNFKSNRLQISRLVVQYVTPAGVAVPSDPKAAAHVPAHESPAAGEIMTIDIDSGGLPDPWHAEIIAAKVCHLAAEGLR